MLLLHGWPEHWYASRNLIPLLHGSHRVICPDPRGFGRTDSTVRMIGGSSLVACCAWAATRRYSSTRSFPLMPLRSGVGPTNEWHSGARGAHDTRASSPQPRPGRAALRRLNLACQAEPSCRRAPNHAPWGRGTMSWLPEVRTLVPGDRILGARGHSDRCQTAYPELIQAAGQQITCASRVRPGGNRGPVCGREPPPPSSSCLVRQTDRHRNQTVLAKPCPRCILLGKLSRETLRVRGRRQTLRGGENVRGSSHRQSGSWRAAS